MCKMIHYKDGKYIADIKHKYILNIVKQAELCENICRIMLFGSSLEENGALTNQILILLFSESNQKINICNQRSSKIFRISCSCMTWIRIMIFYILQIMCIIMIWFYRTLITGWRFIGEVRHEINSSLKNRLRKMPVERVLAKIGKKHSVEAKMAQN